MTLRKKSISIAHLGVALITLAAATPALASDFSGLINIFLGFFAVIGLVVLAVVFGIRKGIAKPGPLADAASAIALALTFAPSTFVNIYGEWTFSFWPVGMVAIFAETWWDLFPGPAISVVVTSGLVFLFFRTRNGSNDSEKEAEPE